ncbi:hypothetical protein TEA_029609 [Camellia sinensis var. sinensis]|uniref:Uncharacterized protein n=1 Tax=Camellia sinensis var. sinensis TaxID=542762 RepID=A0A4S4DP10_CAMSN|nr:hypothetical protein TEA_029609 [Camellia sinensis var. sinensis]
MLRHGLRGKSMAWPASQGCSRRTTRPVASTIPLGNAEFRFAAHGNRFLVSRRALCALGPLQGDKKQSGGTNRSDAGLNVGGSWQQGHSALTIPRRVFKSSAEDSTRRSSSESTVRCPGKAPRGAVPSPSPGRHAATRSRRGSSSSSPPTADGFGTGTPVPSPQSQSFSRSYGSILPTSLAYIVPSTRGCSPWRLAAVMSTTGRGRHSVLRIFKGHRGRTGHHATCGALPAAGPYLWLSRFQVSLRASTGVSSGFAPLRHSSPSFGSRQACSHSNPSQKIKVGQRCNPRGDPVSQLPCALRVYSPVDLHTCQTPWSVFQDRPNGELAGWRRERADAEARPRARAASHDRGEGISADFSTARALASAPIRTDPHPESISRLAGRRFTSNPGASPAPIRFPPDNFKHSLTLFSKSFSSFPRGLHSQTTQLVDSASWCDWVRARRGSHPLQRPFPGTWARSATEDASPDYNSNDGVARVSSCALPGSLAVTRGILGHDRPPETDRTRAMRRNGLSTTTRRDASFVVGDSLLGRPRTGVRGGPTSACSPSSPLRGKGGRGRERHNVRRPGRRALNLMASAATCVQRLDGSRDSAIHTKYRISLRSSSMREPRYPLPRVV